MLYNCVFFIPALAAIALSSPHLSWIYFLFFSRERCKDIFRCFSGLFLVNDNYTLPLPSLPPSTISGKINISIFAIFSFWDMVDFVLKILRTIWTKNSPEICAMFLIGFCTLYENFAPFIFWDMVQFVLKIVLNWSINTITWNSNFSTRKICYLLTSQFFLIKTIYSPIDFDVYFPMQCSEFTKIFKKKRKRKNPHFSIFLIKIKIFPQLDLSDGTIRIQNFHFSRKFWRKNSWKLLK